MPAGDIIVESVMVGPIQTNAYVIGCPTTKVGAIVDPGDEGMRLVRIAQSRGLEVALVLVTHGHVDHVGAVGTVKQATQAEVAMDPADRPLYDACVQQALAFGISAATPPPPDRDLADGDVVEIGTLRARVISTPGHTPGGVSFHFADQAILLAGDTLFQGSVGRTDLPGGSFEQLMSSIHNRLLTLPDDTQVLCGHGPATTIGLEKRHNPFVRGFPPGGGGLLMR